MKLSLIQMNMTLGLPEENFLRAEKLIAEAMNNQPDVIVLPETWNVGFFPKERLSELADDDGKAVKERLGSLAKQYGVNLIAGSVANRRGEKIYNTAFVFDRQGACIAEYDKAHLFSPMGEDRYFEKGDHTTVFTLDGKRCGMLICYDIRFPEWTRTMTAAKPLDCLFVVSQWPRVRMAHLQTLGAARAIENQMFLACCNSCGTAGETVYGGGSYVCDPWGTVLAAAGESEQILTAELDFSTVESIRTSINVFADRRPELYQY